MIDQHIDLSPIVLHFFDQRLHTNLLGDILNVSARPSAAREDLRCDFIHVNRRNVISGHDGAARGKSFG